MCALLERETVKFRTTKRIKVVQVFTLVPWPTYNRPNDELLDTQWTFPRHNIPRVWAQGKLAKSLIQLSYVALILSRHHRS